MLGLFKKTPKLEATFTPRTAVARELAKEVELVGELVVKNVGKDVSVSDVQVVLVAGGTRRIDVDLPRELSGNVSLKAGGDLRIPCNWKVKLVAPMRAPAGEIQINTTTGGKTTPLCRSNRFPLANE